MKTTFISSSAIQNAMRLTVQRAQTEIVKNQTEIATLRHADVGLALGAKSSTSVMLNRDVARLESILDTNELATQRLSVSQQAMGQISDSGQEILQALISVNGANDSSRLDIAKREITNALGTFISVGNTSGNGEFLFSGVNTDVKPLNDYLDPAGSAAKASFDAAFLARFGFTQTDPQTTTITAADMEDFIATDVAALFADPNWQNDWSNASDTNMTSRISNNEVIETSTNANSDGFRKFAMVAVIGIELLGLELSGETRTAVNTKAIELAGEAIGGVDRQRTQLGISEARVTKANVAIEAQKKIVSTYLGNLEGIDPYEASTRMTTLLTQIEASYALTARIQQLSLMNYL